MSVADITVPAGAYIGFDNNKVYKNTVLADGPLRFYILNDPDNVARDSSGNNGPSGTYGTSVLRSPYLCASDYVDGGVHAPTAANATADPQAIIRFPEDAALAALAGSSFSIEYIMSFDYSGSNLSNNSSFINIEDNSGIRITQDPGSSRIQFYLNGTSYLSGHDAIAGTFQPYHTCFTYDYPTQLLSYYSNGELLASATASPGTFNAGTGLVLLQEGNSGSFAWPEEINFLAIYNKALSPSQVTSHANAAGSNIPWQSGGGGSVTRSIGASSAIAFANKIKGAALIPYNTSERYSQTVLADKPLRYYRLNDPDTIARDTSGNLGPSGTWGSSVTKGAHLVASDVVGVGAYFPASGNTSYDANSVISFPEDSGIRFIGTSFSIEYFYQWSGDNSNFGGNECSYINLEDQTGVRVAFPPSQSTQGIVYLNGTSVLGTQIGAYIGIPNHCVITYDSTSNTIKYYQNGALQATATATSGSFNSGKGLSIGQRGVSGSPALYGGISDVAIYGTVLSATQVANHANAAGVNAYPGGTVLESINAAAIITTTQTTSQEIYANSYIGLYNNDGQYAKAVTADGAFRFYKLDEITGNNVAVDSSGNNGPSGTWGSSVSHVKSITPTDYVGGAASFPVAGSSANPNAVIAFPLDTAALPTSSFSVEFLFLPIAPFTQSAFGNNQQTAFEWQPNTGIRMHGYYNDGQAYIQVAGTQVLGPEPFVQQYKTGHVVVTYDAPTNTLKYYMNGSLVASANPPTPPTFTDGTGFLIGNSAAANPNFKAAFDNVAIYKYALTEAQVTNHANIAGANAPGQNGGTAPRAISAQANVVNNSTITTISINAAAYLVSVANQPIGAASSISNRAQTSIAAASSIASKVATSIGAGSRITKNATQSLQAGAHISVPASSITIGANASIKGKVSATLGAASSVALRVTKTLTASSLISRPATKTIRAGAYIVAYHTISIGAAADIKATPVGRKITAAATVLSSAKQSFGAASLIEKSVKLTLGAESRASATITGSLQANAIIARVVSETLGAASAIIGIGKQSIGASSQIVTSTSEALQAASIISITESASLGAGAYVNHFADLTIGAASLLTQNAQTRITAGAFVQQNGSISITAAARVFRYLFTFRIIQAAARIIAQGEKSIGAASFVAFTPVEQSLGAGAFISISFSPTLSANAFIVIAAYLSIGAGARVGKRAQSVINRELTVYPYYGE